MQDVHKIEFTELAPELCLYWTFKEEISIEDGILLKGERIIIPALDQPDILQQRHHGHLGLQKCLHHAPVSVYRPNLTEQLKELVTNCRVCLKYSKANCKDSKGIGPSLGQEIPTRPWAKHATDIFTINIENYLPIVDYMSRCSVIRCLSNMTAKMVAEHMKAIFSELGVPKTLVSDNGPCYTGD